MLRQVARSTLSRRDRKVRHLAVAEYLRSTFADDGEEVMDVVARHYLDALDAVPSDVGTWTKYNSWPMRSLPSEPARGAERAGALGRAAALYQRAAELHERQMATPLLRPACGSRQRRHG